MSTYPVCVNITIAIPDPLVDKARRWARKQGISLQDAVRRYLEGVVGGASREAVADELLQLMREKGGRSKGRRFRRADAYQGRL